MEKLAGTDALILDLRSCPGGTGMTTRALESIFFDEPTELVTMAVRGQEPTAVMSSDETPGGVKYLGKPVYILTSATTGSGCEEVAWCLKYHHRATLVGENTAGAGHGITGIVDLGHGLNATVPSMLPIHPHFDGGWEAVGVPPDVTIGSRSAADQAHLLALSALMESADEEELRGLESIHAATALEIARRQREYAVQGLSLRTYCSSFQTGVRLHIKDGELFHTDQSGRSSGPLVAMEIPDHFELARGAQQMVVKVERDDAGEIRALAVSQKGSDDWKEYRRVGPM